MTENCVRVEYVGEGPLEEMAKLRSPQKMDFVHWFEDPRESHIITTDTVFTKGEKGSVKSYVFCPVHKEYVDVTGPASNSQDQTKTESK